MTNNAKRLLKVYVELDDNDKKEIFEKIQKIQISTLTERTKLFSESLNEAKILGPVASGGCPYCGR